MTWTSPAMAFKCGACGTSVTGIVTCSHLDAVMERHAGLCPARANSGENGLETACESPKAPEHSAVGGEGT